MLLVWFNMLAHAPAGVCDRTIRTISEETGLSVERVTSAVVTLESPDPESRTHDEQGRRILRLSEHRTWGWKLVNWEFYNNLLSESDRRIKDAERQRKYREKKQCHTLSQNVTKPYTYASSSTSSWEGSAEGNPKKKFTPPTLDELKKYAATISMAETEAEKCFDFYSSKGWLVGKSPMKDWKAAVRNWNRNSSNYSSPKQQSNFRQINPHTY